MARKRLRYVKHAVFKYKLLPEFQDWSLEAIDSMNLSKSSRNMGCFLLCLTGALVSFGDTAVEWLLLEGIGATVEHGLADYCAQLWNSLG